MSRESEVCLIDGSAASSRSSFTCNDKGEINHGGDDWGEMEEMFTQHCESLSQHNEGDRSVDEDTDEPIGKRLFDERDDRKFSARPSADDIQPSTKPSAAPASTAATSDDCMTDMFAYNYCDEELNKMCEIVEASRSPQISPSGSTSNSASIAVGFAGAATALPPATEPRNTKKRQPSLFQTVSTKKKRKWTRRSTSGSSHVQENTLTQHFSSTKKEKANKTMDGQSAANGLVTISRFRGGKDVSFKPGDVWHPHDKKYRVNGFAFTLGEIGIANQIYVADIAIVWMKAENAFLGNEAVTVKAATGSEWVMAKKHELLPANGRIELRRLSHRMTENLPDESKSLCYEQEGKMTHAFYYECKNPVQRLSNPNDRPRALDLFAGAGGTSIGLERAGINVLWKNEYNRTASYSLMMNFPQSYIFCEDISKFLHSCKEERVSIYPKRGEVDHLHGSPPCQGFSAVNTTGGANDDQNNNCTITYLEAVSHFRPNFISMENVPGIGMEKNISYLLRIVGGFLSMNYQVRMSIVKSHEFGDPQTRARVIVLASMKGYTLPKLISTHGEGSLDVVTAGDVLRDLEEVDPVAVTGLVELPDGGPVYDHYVEGTLLSEKKYDKDYVLNAAKPAHTVRKGNQVKHYKHDRYITARERARLQSFPDSHRFAGTRQDIFDQIGNAVPIGLATAIGRAVMESYRLGRHG